MTLPMDVRLASANARFGFVFARRGIVPEACSSWFLPRVVGISQALEWTYSGRVFAADEALAGRLVSRVLEPDALLPAAYALAHEIADNTSAVSIALTRSLLWRMLGADHPMAAHQIDSKCIYAMGRSADAREGVSSFLEKRPPRFSMRPSADMPDFYPWWPERKFSTTDRTDGTDRTLIRAIRAIGGQLLLSGRQLRAGSPARARAAIRCGVRSGCASPVRSRGRSRRP